MAASYIAIPEAFSVENAEMDIDTVGANAGRTYRKENFGNWVQRATKDDESVFYSYLLKSFSSSL